MFDYRRLTLPEPGTDDRPSEVPIGDDNIQCLQEWIESSASRGQLGKYVFRVEPSTCAAWRDLVSSGPHLDWPISTLSSESAASESAAVASAFDANWSRATKAFVAVVLSVIVTATAILLGI